MTQQARVTITLDRGKTGLGFNIRGGRDIPVFPNDSGIFVAKINEGAALKDGRLKEGDKIIEINGTNIETVTHQEAVDLFRSSVGNEVTMVVIPGEEKRLRRAEIRHEQTKWVTTGVTLTVGVGVIVAAAFVFYRMKFLR